MTSASVPRVGAGGVVRPAHWTGAAFSLVEVVLALGICAFGIVALIGLFSTGVQTSRESQDEIEAANVASYLIAVRTASPTNAIANFGIPALPSGFAGGAVTNYIGFDGLQTNASAAAYRLVCSAATNAVTGSSLSQLYLLLSWPPAADPGGPTAKKYDLLTYIPLP